MGLHIHYSRGLAALAVFSMTMLSHGMVAPNTRTFGDGEVARIRGIIISRDGETLKLRGDDEAVGTVNLTDATKVLLKHGMFGMAKTNMDVTSLLPGLRIVAEGKGNGKGELDADKITFDPNSMKASRAIDTRVGPVEGRTGKLEGRAGQLETRAGDLETRAGQLENGQKQTEQKVGQVKAEADQANQGVESVNRRVSDMDDYVVKDSATVYFKLNSTVLTAEGKKDLDDIAQKAQAEKGYMIEVAGFADKTGNIQHNQELSEKRAQAVVTYLQEQGNVPLRRILAPAGLGISHEAADNNTTEGRKMNRRVEVKVLVNKGVVTTAGSAAPSPNQ